MIKLVEDEIFFGCVKLKKSFGDSRYVFEGKEER
jgi:hypothetical protein